MEEIQNKNYISLIEAAKLCSYSEPYLRLRARQGKLKSIKLGKKWVTTASWLDDYERRVQEWRAAAEAKKENAAAVFVAAPAELSGVLGPAIDSPIEQNDLIPEADPVSTPVAVFCAAQDPLLPPPVPKRLRPLGFSGQIYPLPKQSQLPETQNYGWFGALVSGAACALILFLAVNPGGISKLMDMGSSGAGQANIGKAVVFNEELPSAVQDQAQLLESAESLKPAAIDLAPAVFGNDPLKELVSAIEAFFRNF